MPTVYSPKDSNGFRIKIVYTVTTPGTGSTATSPRSTVAGTMYLETTVPGEYFSQWTLTAWLNIWGSHTTTDTYPVQENKQYSIANPTTTTPKTVAIGTFTKTIYHDPTDGTGYFYFWSKLDADTNAGYVPANLEYGPQYFALTDIAVTPPTPSYTVTYSNADGSNGTTTQTVVSGNTGTFPDPGTRTDYTFNKWDGSYSAGTATPAITANTTYTAYWTALQWTVTYNANSGTVDPASASVDRGSAVTLPTPSRSGYSFNGWFTASSGGTSVGGGSASYTPTKDITIYAQWTVLAPGFTDESVTGTLYINQDISSTGNASVSATNTTSYSLQYSGTGLNPTSWLSINATTGALSGSTSIPGVYTFKVVATGTSVANSNTITITVVYPGKRINSSLGQAQFATAKRYDLATSSWVPLALMKRFVGVGQPGADANGWAHISN
jgi:uncharacterized repeat protein (TIGR02543 family)